MSLGVRWPWPRLGCDTAQTRPAAPRVTPWAKPSPPLCPGQAEPFSRDATVLAGPQPGSPVGRGAGGPLGCWGPL